MGSMSVSETITNEVMIKYNQWRSLEADRKHMCMYTLYCERRARSFEYAGATKCSFNFGQKYLFVMSINIFHFYVQSYVQLLLYMLGEFVNDTMFCRIPLFIY